ncbi:hypothetical protein GWI33_005769, partial [Rhynchophorus ferrugineus]
MRLILFSVILLGTLSNIEAACTQCGEEPETIINCDGKYFSCVNQTYFYQCASYGPITLAFSSQEVQECPEGLICSDANKWECVEPSESSTTTECPNVTETQTTTSNGGITTKAVVVTTISSESSSASTAASQSSESSSAPTTASESSESSSASTAASESSESSS